MANSSSTRWQRARFRREPMRYIHVARVGAAFSCSLVIAAYFPNPHVMWMQISILAVMAATPYAGNITAKARERALGTLIGGLAGIAAVHIDALGGTWARLAIQSLGALAGTYLALGPYGGAALVSAVTLEMVANAGDVDTALWRVFNVTLGAAIALVFAYAVPTRARVHAAYLLADNIRDLHEQYARLATHREFDDEKADAVLRRGRQLRAQIPAISRESGIDAAALGALLHSQRSLLGLLEQMADNSVVDIAPAEGASPADIDAAFRAIAAHLPASQIASQDAETPCTSHAHPLDARLLKALRDHHRRLATVASALV